MQPLKTVVTISRDAPLQMTRTFLLQEAGYEVIALASDDSAREFLRLPHQAQPNLVLMCHTVPESSRVALSSAIKWRFPSTPILMLYNGYDPTVAEVDGGLENVRDPQALLDTVQLLLSTKQQKRI
jgi:DNA-binding NarL/FixJ family response regulator